MARKSTVVDRPLFEAAVKNAEANGALKNLGELHNAVVKHYTILTLEKNDLKPISAAIVRDRLAEWQIETLTTSGKGEKPDLIGRRINGIVAGINFVIERIPAEMTEVLDLLNELKTITVAPLEPAVSSLPPAEVAETEEIIDPNAVDVPVPSAETLDVIFQSADETDSQLAA